MARVLVTEKLATGGLDLLREAGHDVDVQLGLDPGELKSAIVGAHGLIIRSATHVTADLLAAATDLQVVGRAGVGLDNVDTGAATERGIIVANAPTSNSVSAAEHTMAMLLASARNVPQAHAALVNGRWERSAWGGVELLDKTLGIIGLGNIGGLVAQRAKAFGMSLVGHDPFVSKDRASQLGVELMELDELIADSDFVTLHIARTPETMNLINAERLIGAKPNLRLINVARGGIVNEADLAAAIEAGTIAGAAIDVFDSEPKTESPLFSLSQVVVTPHLGASTTEAQDRAGMTIAEQVRLALAGEFVPFGVNIAARGVSEVVRPFLPLAEQLGAQFSRLVGGRPGAVDVVFAGEIGGFDCRMAELAITKGLLSDLADATVTYVNAEALAAKHGLEVTARASTKTPSGLVNGIKVEGDGHSIAGTIDLPTGEARIVSVDDITVDLPPTEHLLLILNDDTPGMIGHVGTIFGAAEINIDDMHLGKSTTRGLALMAISTSVPIPRVITAKILELPSILSVKEIGVTL
ncbi:MAG: D-3-phosphoglycerate dehydrogenase [Verrucomicrobiales bacterium]|jgi:D-3-phosphoglycerate dehydrogenase